MAGLLVNYLVKNSFFPGFRFARGFLLWSTTSASNLSIAVIASSSLNHNLMVDPPQSSHPGLVKATHRRHSIEQDLPPSYEAIVTTNDNNFVNDATNNSNDSCY